MELNFIQHLVDNYDDVIFEEMENMRGIPLNVPYEPTKVFLDMIEKLVHNPTVAHDDDLKKKMRTFLHNELVLCEAEETIFSSDFYEFFNTRKLWIKNQLKTLN